MSEQQWRTSPPPEPYTPGFPPSAMQAGQKIPAPRMPGGWQGLTRQQKLSSLWKTQDARIAALLVLIVCIGGLGTLPLTPALLPGLVQPARATLAHAPALTPTPAVPTPTPIVGPFTESECTATPQKMHYLPTTEQTTPSALPLAWIQAGRNEQDLALAQACAAAFIIAYESFDAGHMETLEASTPMLTDAARARFYGRAANTSPDQHMDPMWRASIQQEQIQQVAQVGQPGLLAASERNGLLLAWMGVPCLLTVQIAAEKPEVESVQFTVLLVGVPLNAQKTGTGWQVSEWQAGNTVFPPPAQI